MFSIIKLKIYTVSTNMEYFIIVYQISQSGARKKIYNHLDLNVYGQQINFGKPIEYFPG